MYSRDDEPYNRFMDHPRPTASIIFPEQYGEAARALGRAFIDDPPIRVLLPEPEDPVERARLLTIFFEAILGIQRGSGEPVIGVMMDDKVVAAAIVEGAGAASIANLILHGLARVPGMLRGGEGGFGVLFGLWRRGSGSGEQRERRETADRGGQPGEAGAPAEGWPRKAGSAVRSRITAMGIMQKLCTKPAANRSGSPQTADPAQEKSRFSENQPIAPATMERAGRIHAP